MLNTKFFQDVDIKHAEIKPGRLLHVRICSDPAIDLLCVYQHAWNPAKAEYQQRSLSAEQLLMNSRQDIWQRMQGWIAGVPKRNLLAVLGDFNAALSPHHPHVGTGVGPAHDHKKDGHALQSLIQTAVLNAINTWRKRGSQASTFWTHRGEGSQIDFILTRNPCTISQLRPNTLQQAPIVRPTGFRHVPVQCYLQWPKPPRTTQSPKVTAFQVKRVFSKSPQVLEHFRDRVQQLDCSAEHLDFKLQEVWQQCCPQKAILPVQQSSSDSICLKNFWASKRRLQSLSVLSTSISWPLRCCGSHASADPLLSACKYMQHLLACWKATACFQRLNTALRKSSQQAGSDKVDGQIQGALEADKRGLTYLYKCMNTMRPKNPKRTVHIKSSEGRLQSNSSELATITSYFSSLFESTEPPILPQWHLQSPLDISHAEIRQALGSLSSKKALPKSQAPAALWKAGDNTVEIYTLQRLSASLFTRGDSNASRLAHLLHGSDSEARQGSYITSQP